MQNKNRPIDIENTPLISKGERGEKDKLGIWG